MAAWNCGSTSQFARGAQAAISGAVHALQATRSIIWELPAAAQALLSGQQYSSNNWMSLPATAAEKPNAGTAAKGSVTAASDRGSSSRVVRQALLDLRGDRVMPSQSSLKAGKYYTL